ncbi:MAG: hypothetical protein Q4F57_04280 [Weeksellaceae bacterium]|nr:hypothetical protein [Weeksellaceae bacterium]
MKNLYLNGSKSYSALLLIVFFASYSWASNFDFTLTPIPETCAGNGGVTANFTGANPGQSSFTFRLVTVPANNLVSGVSPSNPYTMVASSATFSQTFGNLAAGSYRMEVTEVDQGQTRIVTRDFTVANQIIVPVVTGRVNQCTYRTVTANLTTPSVGPYVYSIINQATGAVVATSPQTTATTYTFPNVLPNGTYSMRVLDSCGTAEISTFVINPPTVTYSITHEFHIGSRPVDIAQRNCQVIERRSRITRSINGVEQTNVGAEIFPVTVTFNIDNGAQIVTRTLNTATELNGFLWEYDFTTTASRNVQISIADACGNTTGPIAYNTPNAEKNFNINLLQTSCTAAIILQLSNFSGFDYMANGGQGFRLLLEKILPDGTVDTSFIASQYNSSFAPDNTIYKTNYSGLSLTGVPEGTYRATVSDGCTNNTTTLSKTSSILGSSQYGISFYSYGACSPDRGTFSMFVNSGTPSVRGASLQTVTVTQAPAAFVAQFGPLPVNVTQYIRNPGSTSAVADGIMYVESWPAGTYTFNYTHTCGSGTTTQTLPGKVISNYNTNVNYTCDGASLSTTLTSNLAKHQLFLQKWYPEQNSWGHPDTGVLYTEGSDLNNTNPTQARMITAYPIPLTTPVTIGNSNYLITQTGRYRILVQHSTYVNGMQTTNDIRFGFGATRQQKYCRQVLEEIEINPTGIQYRGFASSACATGGYELHINATSSNLQYQIVEYNGEPIENPTAPQTSPVFTVADIGTYLVQITDNCGRQRQVRIFVSPTIVVPTLNATDFCPGQMGSLFIQGYQHLTYEWFFNGTPIPNASGVGRNRYTISNFDNTVHPGDYMVQITYPGGCLFAQREYTLLPSDATPNAGTGQTITIDIEDVSDAINLFALLTDDPDNTGYWVDVDQTGELMADVFHASAMNVGTYNFDYVVDPTCTGVPDIARVTINITGACYKLANTAGTNIESALVGITDLQRASEGPDNWPGVRKGAHLVLESPSRGFVLNRVANPETDIPQQDWVDGMAVFDTTLQCLRIYVVDEAVPANSAWRCFTQPTCN